MVIVHDTKRPETSAHVFIPINFFFSGIRPPGAFNIALWEWEPTKVLLLVGDSTTSDIGLLCYTTDDKWVSLTFDEGVPSMPLDVDQNETTMVGFKLNLKNMIPYDVTTSAGETILVPPPPVVWAYGSDGTVTVWYVVNTPGTPYPGMAQETTLSQSAATLAFGQSGFGQSASQSAFGKMGLGTPMSMTPIVTPVSAMNPCFGSGGTHSAFALGGPRSSSGSKPAETKLVTPTMSSGFGAFASNGPSVFGQPQRNLCQRGRLMGALLSVEYLNHPQTTLQHPPFCKVQHLLALLQFPMHS